jgi:5-methylcytosine-specific restriction endonuclease McrA
MPYKDKEKRKEYARLWVAQRRAEFFDGKFCVKCGSAESLELDHIDPEEKIHHAIWSWSAERREAELAKCQVLCNTCHKEKTRAWYIETVGHGLNLYKRHGCRCDICKYAKKVDNASRYK